MTVPNCAGRFPTNCATDFPEVTNYDYESNLQTRGINNREFRWEDIFVNASWLFLEATQSGSFEYNNFRTGVSSTSGNLAITQPGVAYSGYSGWVLSGGYSYYIGKSGSLLYTGNLSGYTGINKWVNPIDSDEAIGLWCNSSNIPKVTSTNIEANASGILAGSNHQFYMVALANIATGLAPRLKAYIKASIGATVVGYYDPVEEEWTATYPTGSFSISTGALTEIKYSFNPSSLPFSDPDTYNVVIENYITGSFITIDDVHVDQYMKKNPYVDYILPTGYMVQVTPDLGWHNSLAQFDGDGVSSNPFLKTFGPFSIDAGNLTDNLDNTVSAAIDSGDFRSITSNIYKKYLWRAIAISPNGALGKAGLPESFSYVGREIENDFEILNIDQDPTTTIRTISGRRTIRLSVLVNGVANHPGLEYPTPNSWKLSIHVDGSSQTVALNARDVGGATTSIQYIELKNSTHELRNKALWNVFDEHGLMLDLKRLPNESNKRYSDRLKDVNRNRGGSTFIGVANSATRELGLIKVLDAISLSIAKNQFEKNIHRQVFVSFESASVLIKTDSMIYTERVYVDPVYTTATLSKFIEEVPLSVVTSSGIEVPQEYLSIERDEDRPSIQRIKVDFKPALGTYIDVSYKFIERLTYKNYPELGLLVQALDSLQDNAGSKLLSASLSMKLSGNESCMGLFLVTDYLSIDETLQISWTPIVLRRVSDKEFREHFISEDGTYHDTKFQTYVNELRRNSRTIWNSVETDRDIWDAAAVDQSFDYIPTLFDPSLAKFTSNSGDGVNQNIDPTIAWSRSYVGYSQEIMNNLGIDYRYFHPGVAHTHDLEPGIVSKQLIDSPESDSRNTISEELNRNNRVILFSGQR